MSNECHSRIIKNVISCEWYEIEIKVKDIRYQCIWNIFYFIRIWMARVIIGYLFLIFHWFTFCEMRNYLVVFLSIYLWSLIFKHLCHEFLFFLKKSRISITTVIYLSLNHFLWNGRSFYGNFVYSPFIAHFKAFMS